MAHTLTLFCGSSNERATKLQGRPDPLRLCTTNRREGPDTQSALANRQFVTSFCTILSNPSCRKVIDKADCTRMFQIGDRRMLVAYFRTEFVRRDLLCKALKSRDYAKRASDSRWASGALEGARKLARG